MSVFFLLSISLSSEQFPELSTLNPLPTLLFLLRGLPLSHGLLHSQWKPTLDLGGAGLGSLLCLLNDGWPGKLRIRVQAFPSFIFSFFLQWG